MIKNARESEGRTIVPPYKVLTTDYYSEALKESKSIWQHDRMPLKIYLRDGYGHSQDPHDVMYFPEPLRITRPAPPARDLKTIGKLYENQ